MSIIGERFAALVHNALPYRELVVSISRADERRLARHIESVNRDMPDEPLGRDDIDLAIALMGCALTGLAEGEAEDGVWVDPSGRHFDLPRPVRAPWRHRVKFAWRAGRQTWRAT
jgi:hypothetical protein